MKKSIIFIFVLIATLFSSVTIVSADYGIAPCFENISSCTQGFDINEDGTAEITLRYTGYFGAVSNATITTTLERAIEGTSDWEFVEDWVDESTERRFYITHNYPLTERGTYRIVTRFYIVGTDGTVDDFTETLERTY